VNAWTCGRAGASGEAARRSGRTRAAPNEGAAGSSDRAAAAGRRPGRSGGEARRLSDGNGTSRRWGLDEPGEKCRVGLLFEQEQVGEPPLETQREDVSLGPVERAGECVDLPEDVGGARLQLEKKNSPTSKGAAKDAPQCEHSTAISSVMSGSASSSADSSFARVRTGSARAKSVSKPSLRSP
jgi:hypothetical protein